MVARMTNGMMPSFSVDLIKVEVKDKIVERLCLSVDSLLMEVVTERFLALLKLRY
jgi:hypothetical protein